MSDLVVATTQKSSRIPSITAFNQQRLPAWQPVYTAKSVLPLFAVVFVSFIGIGILLLFTSWRAVEYSYDYTDCLSLENPLVRCSSVVENVQQEISSCTCLFSIEVPIDLDGDVYMYYGLDGFYQNHRRYVKSRDDYQLIGKNVDVSNISEDCAPYDIYRSNGQEKVIAPCGAIANSLFNDTYLLTLRNISVPILRTGIAWPSDHSEKFNNPQGDIETAFNNTESPLFWKTPVQYLDNSSDINNGYENEPFIVWMRTAAFPTFRKLYGHLDRLVVFFQNGLPLGSYNVLVSYNYPVTGFGGRKRFIVATTTWMGGKNDFLGIAYICSGIISGFLCAVLWAIHHVGTKMQLINDRPVR